MVKEKALVDAPVTQCRHLHLHEQGRASTDSRFVSRLSQVRPALWPSNLGTSNLRDPHDPYMTLNFIRDPYRHRTLV